MDRIWWYFIKAQKEWSRIPQCVFSLPSEFLWRRAWNRMQVKVQNNIIHTENYPTQYKCHHNFFKVATFGEVNGSRQNHKLTQKYGFKEPWDATKKLAKEHILRNELKYDRWADTRECYLKLKRDFKKKYRKKYKDWSNWKRDGDERILQNTTFTSQRTFIGLCIEDNDKYL